MKIICPNCRESYIFDLDSINIEPISKAVIETRDFLKGEIDQINNVINICEKDTMNSINQLKNIKSNTESVIEKMDDCISVLNDIYDTFKDIKQNKIPKDIIERYNVRGTWKSFVANLLFSRQYANYDVYVDILIKAAILGEDGVFWSHSSNFHLEPFELMKLKLIFELKEENKIPKNFRFEGDEDYEIKNFKPGISFDIQKGDIGGTIAKTKKSFIFGIFNSKVDYALNGKKGKQNLELCHKIVEELKDKFISLNY